MAKQTINIGTIADDGTGSTIRAGGDIANDNFNELYTKLGDGSTLYSLTFPNATDTVVARDTSDTLTNKTLTSAIVGTSLDLNASELILDADADTSITADTDDQIDIKIGGNDRITLQSGIIDLKNDGSESQVKLYCEVGNAHYTQIQASPHANYGGGSVTVVVPAVAGTLALRPTTTNATGDGSTVNYTLTNINNDVDSVMVFLNGVLQRPTTDYTISGTTLTFGTAPVAADAITIKEF
jgi:hypothetical protein